VRSPLLRNRGAADDVTDVRARPATRGD